MMEEDKKTRQERNVLRKERQALRESGQSVYMRDMMNDLEGRPEEVIYNLSSWYTNFAFLWLMLT